MNGRTDQQGPPVETVFTDISPKGEHEGGKCTNPLNHWDSYTLINPINTQELCAFALWQV